MKVSTGDDESNRKGKDAEDIMENSSKGLGNGLDLEYGVVREKKDGIRDHRVIGKVMVTLAETGNWEGDLSPIRAQAS